MSPPPTHLRNDASGPRRRRDDDRGVAFIEFLLAIPFLMVMVFGIVETGLGWRAVVQVNSAVRAGARVASKDSNQTGSADYDTLAAISASLPSDLKGSSSNLMIVIYNANSTGATVPAACTTATAITNHGVNSGGVKCNTYTAADLSLPSTSFGVGGVDNNWCPTTCRNADLTNGTIDYVGVYISTKHLNQTHTYFGDFTIQRSVVFRLEPNLP